MMTTRKLKEILTQAENNIRHSDSIKEDKTIIIDNTINQSTVDNQITTHKISALQHFKPATTGVSVTTEIKDTTETIYTDEIKIEGNFTF